MTPITRGAFDHILREARARSHAPDSPLHGDRHWRGVAISGIEIATWGASRNPAIPLLFAVFHDSCRMNDDVDPEHGTRAAEAVYRSRPLKRLLTPGQISDLADACRDHEKGRTTLDPDIGTCWDADRLNLVRVGITPHRDFMSVIRHPDALAEMTARAEARWRDPPDWDTLARMAWSG